jgi:hypothetical protein
MPKSKKKPNRNCYTCCTDGLIPFLVIADGEHFIYQGTDFTDAVEYASGTNAENIVTIRRVPPKKWDRFVKSVVK